MKTAALLTALVAVSASLAHAEKYTLHNGRAAAGGSGGGRSSGAGGGHSGSAPARQAGGGVGAGTVYGAPVDAGGPASSDGRFVASRGRSGGGHRSFWGGGAQLGRNVYRVPQRAAEGGSGPASDPGGSAPEERPPYFDKPGALIRTEGHMQPQYAEAGNHREHTVAAGAIALDPRKAHSLTGPGLRVGPRDTPPPCTPGTNGCSGGGGNSITPNSGGNTIINNERHNGAHDNENGNAGGNGNGFGGGTGFDPSF